MTSSAPASASPPAPSALRGWIVVASALGINLILGVLYSWGVLGKALVVQWGWTKAQAAAPFTASTAAFAIMMIFAGRMQDKIGPRWVAALGGLVLGGGLFASAWAQSPFVMMLTFGVVGGMGIGLGYSATTPPSVKWFSSTRRGLITGIVVSGVGLAAIYMAPLTQYLVGSQGIAKTFQILGAGTMLLVGLFAMFLRNPPAGYVPGGAPATPASSSTPAANAVSALRRDLDWYEMLRTRQFYQLWAMMALASAAGMMIVAHATIIAKEQAGWEGGFLLLVLLAIFNTAGRLVAGFLADAVGGKRTFLLLFGFQAVNMFVFSQYTTPWLLAVGAAVTGLCYGGIFTVFPATTASFYGVRHLGVNYGLVFTAFGVAGVLGPLLGGRLRDEMGTYAASYQLAGVLLLAAAVLALITTAPWLRRPEPPRRECECECADA